MAFTESTCRSGGSNLSAGSLDGSAEAATAPLITYTNGAWVSGTGVFTPVTGNPVTAGVAVGNWVSIYTDGASAPTGFVGRVTARDTLTITVSLTAKSGTIPTTGATGITLVVGGAWLGPTGASGFPFGFITNAQTNVSADKPRVNFKSDQTYSITAAMTHSNTGPFVFQGYTATFGDGGRFIVDGGSSGASYALLTFGAGSSNLADSIFQNNGATGSASGVVWNASTLNCTTSRVVAHDVRGNGLDQVGNSGAIVLTECEAYLCNTSNTASKAGIWIDAGVLVRCIAHDNAGSNTRGFYLGGGSLVYVTALIDCISDGNGSHGVEFIGTSGGGFALGCDLYNNAGDGIKTASGGRPNLYAENCNFVKNGAYGINGNSNANLSGIIRSCGFGSGTQANTSGQTNIAGPIVTSGAVTYASGVTPWVDPANGDFRINLAAAKGTGRGTFTETQASYTGTVGYPDIGSAQHLDSPPTLICTTQNIFLTND